MKIKNIDLFIITTEDLQACLDFYVGILGMEHHEANGHHNLYFAAARFLFIQRKVSSCQPLSTQLSVLRTSA